MVGLLVLFLKGNVSLNTHIGNMAYSWMIPTTHVKKKQTGESPNYQKKSTPTISVFLNRMIKEKTQKLLSMPGTKLQILGILTYYYMSWILQEQNTLIMLL